MAIIDGPVNQRDAKLLSMLRRTMTMTSELLPRNSFLDEDGFLSNPSSWSPQLATTIANHAGIRRLSERHWIIINALRDEYDQTGIIPTPKHLCHKHHLNEKQTYALFRNRFNNAWRIAGLPNPGEEAISYL